MRWVALGVDYEMYGKDLTDSGVQSGKIARVLGDAEHKQRMAALGVELMSSTPEGFAELIKTETARMSGVLKNTRREK